VGDITPQHTPKQGYAKVSTIALTIVAQSPLKNYSNLLKAVRLGWIV